MTDSIILLGADSLGRNLDDILIESVVRSLIFGISTGTLIVLISVVLLYIWFRASFSRRMTRFVIIADHIFPKMLVLLMLSSIPFENEFVILIIGITTVLLPSLFSQLMIQVNAKSHPGLKDYYQTRSNYGVLFICEVLPLVGTLFILIFFSAVIYSILLESVLTHLGIGFQFGTPSVGFLLSDGFNNFYQNKTELFSAITIIIFVATAGALISNKTSKELSK